MDRTPLILDLSSHNTVEDFNLIRAAGIRAVILKATQGLRFVDKTYHGRVAKARAAGLLVGAYHFSESGDTEAQVDHFLGTVGDTTDLLLALDYEPEPNGRTMSYQQARRFLALVAERTGQKPVLYSGHLLKQELPKGGDAFMASHRLWLAQYAAQPALPRGFSKCWLWQYSDKGHCAGIRRDNSVDLNAFGGSDLAAEWIERADVPKVDVPVALVGESEHMVIPAADGEKPGLVGRVTAALDTSDRHYNIIKRLAEQGSRVANVFSKGTSWFWRLLVGGTGGVGAASQLVDTTKETGPFSIISRWIELHPFLFAGICISVCALVVYFVLKMGSKYIVTAYKDGRYQPRGSQ